MSYTPGEALMLPVLGYAMYTDSPGRQIGRWKTPTLVRHGGGDDRVPIRGGLALFEGLQHHGASSELLVLEPNPR